MTTAITNTEDTIDSRDVIDRIDDLENTLEGVHSDYEDGVVKRNDEREIAWAEVGDPGERPDDEDEEVLDFDDWLKEVVLADPKHLYFEEAEEFTKLKAFAEEAEGCTPDWYSGATLVRRGRFVDYCKELCADIGAVPRDIPDYIAIDWEATASNLEADYSSVDFDGEEYLVR